MSEQVPGRLYGRRRRPGRPRADHAQGGPADRRGRRRRLPLGDRRPLDRADHRRRPGQRGRGRGAADLPRHDRHDRPPAGLLRRDRGLLRRVGRTAGQAPRRRARRGRARRGRPDVLQLVLLPARPAGAALRLRGRARGHVGERLDRGARRTPVARHEDVLTVLPGTLGVPELARRLAGTDAAAIMKLGRTFAGVVEALRQAGRLDEARYVERASTGRERVLPGPRRRPGPGALLRDGAGARSGPPSRRGRPCRLGAVVRRPGRPRTDEAGCWSSGSARARTPG